MLACQAAGLVDSHWCDGLQAIATIVKSYNRASLEAGKGGPVGDSPILQAGDYPRGRAGAGINGITPAKVDHSRRAGRQVCRMHQVYVQETALVV